MMNKRPKDNHKKIVVALSGGVDSAVAAALLKKQGYEVIGAYFVFTKQTWKLSFQVKKIANKLGIPLKIIDARKEFKKRVIDYFLNAYKKGQTPNPCVVCNKEMKFCLLFDLMKKEKADYAATGHYAKISGRILAGESKSGLCLSASKPPKFFKAGLFEAEDKTKDQSYFLYKLAQKDLSKIIFPLGGYKKSEVKKMAKEMKLPVATNESQDICFMPDNDAMKYFSKNIESETGNIIDEAGKVLGRHRGLPIFTIGQRKGIEIGGTGPYWVIGKNIRKNELIVTNDSKKLHKEKFWVSKVNWTNEKKKSPFRADVQIRYHSTRISAKIIPGKSGRLLVETKRPFRAVTAGQSAVFYKNGEVLGGGTII
ncbi:MAG: hypothetical protein UX02_C0002G0184 [Candidatus Moranbacteria bacterium GW2011_GWC1_45_18]|nr:MAG: tRNA-specific 2-thiouridylase MnmA [Candidatus Moranbacteria bacterium GW2011_GWC2_40_12]KKT32804.1 MAG: tRNA-specific 2-thiouridylase MnmA [Candidatus Moranbacteria bacterium GW2011_GWF2_44_10]KKT99865.1 MAG: hypothetical protein UX02_C0002G0184 [Candidatus Moranbacteria bacterium GW2011_GWC1_45_18]HBB36974.1 tRNA 2-thiouridine(34) synthase MnmA [Candidatus Moranbacteria bacterium]HBU25013.1 tRNA 2-thiouridine(34) synthase MnmA [Candidatus Moranbacteria bacterium]